MRPTRIPGRWRDGWALDHHTQSSVYLGDDEYGHPQFDTKRTEVGDLLYRLKYRNDASVTPQIVERLVRFLSEWRPDVSLILPVPPSRPRPSQPVYGLAQSIATVIGIPCSTTAITKTREAPELKNVYEHGERVRLLLGAHAIDARQVGDQRILLFDDLYRSGATMNVIAGALYDNGAADVFALVVTRTRSNQ